MGTIFGISIGSAFFFCCVAFLAFFWAKKKIKFNNAKVYIAEGDDGSRTDEENATGPNHFDAMDLDIEIDLVSQECSESKSPEQVMDQSVDTEKGEMPVIALKDIQIDDWFIMDSDSDDENSSD